LFLISNSSFAFHGELFSGAIIASIFILLAMDRLFGSIDKQSPSLRFFDAGIILAFGSLFYFNIVFFLPFLWITQFTLRQFNWREFFYTLIGLIVPFLFIYSGYFLYDRSILINLNGIIQWIMLEKITVYSWPFLASISFYLFFIIIASFFAFNKYFSIKIQSRKLYQLILSLFLNGLAIFLFVPSAGIELIYIVAIPSSILLSIYFAECRNTFINQLLFVLLLLVPLIMNIIN
jgi:hypothetical protein